MGEAEPEGAGSRFRGRNPLRAAETQKAGRDAPRGRGCVPRAHGTDGRALAAPLSSVTIVRGAIGKASLWNLAGLGLPVAAAVVAVPFIVRGLGVERFGVLA